MSVIAEEEERMRESFAHRRERNEDSKRDGAGRREDGVCWSEDEPVELRGAPEEPSEAAGKPQGSKQALDYKQHPLIQALWRLACELLYKLAVVEGLLGERLGKGPC